MGNNLDGSARTISGDSQGNQEANPKGLARECLPHWAGRTPQTPPNIRLHFYPKSRKRVISSSCRTPTN